MAGQQQVTQGVPRVGGLQAMAQGGTQEGVPLKTVGGGDSGKRQDGQPQLRARAVSGEPGLGGG